MREFEANLAGMAGMSINSEEKMTSAHLNEIMGAKSDEK